VSSWLIGWPREESPPSTYLGWIPAGSGREKPRGLADQASLDADPNDPLAESVPLDSVAGNPPAFVSRVPLHAPLREQILELVSVAADLPSHRVVARSVSEVTAPDPPSVGDLVEVAAVLGDYAVCL